jgi:hypothetical protein
VEKWSGGCVPLLGFKKAIAELASLVTNSQGHVDRIRGGDLESRSGQCLSDLDLKVLLLSSNRGTDTVWIAKNME